MKRVLLASILVVVGCGRGEEPGWDTGDEPIVIWTIPRPGEAPAPTAQDPSAPDESPDDPARPQPVAPDAAPHQPSVSPVACDADVTEISVPGEFRGTLARGVGDVGQWPCADADGREQRFRFEIFRTMELEISSRYTDTEFSPVLVLQSGCGDQTADRYCSSPLYSHPTGMHGRIQARLEPGTYTLVVDERSLLGYGDGGDFVVNMREVVLADHGTCANSAPLYPDNVGVAIGDDGSTGDLLECFHTARSFTYYHVTVGPGEAVRVHASYEDGALQQGPHVRIAEGCHTTCDGDGEFGVASVANTTDDYRTYRVAVANFQGAPHRVWAEFIALEENAACEAPRPLTAGESVAGDLGAGSAWASACGGDPSRQLFYSVDVPAGHRLLPEVAGAWATVSQSCRDQACNSFAHNTSGRTQRYTVAVHQTSIGDMFELTPHVVPVAANSSCELAAPVAVGGTATGDLRAGGDGQHSCGFVHAEGFSLWYRVDVPAQSGVRLEVEPSREFGGIAVEVVEGSCASRSCVDAHDPYLQGPGTAVFDLDNDGAATRSVWVGVTGESAYDFSPNEITVRAVPR